MKRPAFLTIASAVGIKHGRPPAIYRVNGLVTPYSRGITVTSRAQGQIDMHRQDAIKRGGI